MLDLSSSTNKQSFLPTTTITHANHRRLRHPPSPPPTATAASPPSPTPIAVPSHKRPLTTPTTHSRPATLQCHVTQRMVKTAWQMCHVVTVQVLEASTTPLSSCLPHTRCRGHDTGTTTTRTRQHDNTARQRHGRATGHKDPLPPTATSHQRPHHHTTTTPPPPTNPGDCPRRRTPASKNERPRTKMDAHARGRPPANQDNRPRTRMTARERRQPPANEDNRPRTKTAVNEDGHERTTASTHGWIGAMMSPGE